MTTQSVPQNTQYKTKSRCPERSRPVRLDLSDRPLCDFRRAGAGLPQHPEYINVIRQVSIYGMLAIGMTFVILTGGIDLSIGSVLALAGLVCGAVKKGSRGLLGRAWARRTASDCRRPSPRPSPSA